MHRKLGKQHHLIASRTKQQIHKGEMKVYVHFEEGSDAELHVTLKLTLPKKWNDESPMKLLKVSCCRSPPPYTTTTRPDCHFHRCIYRTDKWAA